MFRDPTAGNGWGSAMRELPKFTMPRRNIVCLCIA